MEKLQQFLSASGTRQSALADSLGINRGYMSQLVNGSKIPSMALAARIQQMTDGAVPVGCWIAQPAAADAAPTPPTEDAA